MVIITMIYYFIILYLLTSLISGFGEAYRIKDVSQDTQSSGIGLYGYGKVGIGFSFYF